MAARALRKMSIDEYIALDRSDEGRWEYVNGEAYAMAGGTSEHAVVGGNLYLALRGALDGKRCIVFNDAQKIATPRTRAYHYPDVSVVCPPFLRDTRDDHALAEPSALFEVLSPTTRDYDQGDKFAHYRSAETLTDYVLIDTDARSIEHRQRLESGQWLVSFVTDGMLSIPRLEISFPISVLWKDLDRLRASE